MTGDRAVRHRVFARLYPVIAAAAERAGGADHRDALLVGLRGRVVEMGAGNGTNFVYYPPTVTEVIAVEPEPYLRARAAEAARQAPVPVTVVEGTAGAISLPDASVDAGVASLVLCTVPDQAAALGELRRVIRPGGELRFYEHVVSDAPGLARLQRCVDPIWGRFVGGCHITRDTGAAISAAGFVVESCERFLFPTFRAARLSAPHILGRARRPD